MTLRSRVTVVVASATMLASAVAAAAAPPPLPMTWQFFTPPGSNVRALRFTGRVPSTAPGQRVTILGIGCVDRFWRQLRITQTVAGGGWEAILGGPFGKPDDFETGRTYRARWKGRWSVPFTFRYPMRPGVEKLSEGRYKVTVSTGYGGPLQSLTGRPVVLQRATRSGWVNTQSARLRLVDARTFAATFLVRQTGLTLRALVPLRTARPCFNAGASPNFQS